MVGFSQFWLLPHLQTSLRSITWNSWKVDKEVTALTTRNGISLDCPTNKALSKKKKSHWIMLVWSILKSLFPATIFSSQSEDIIAVVSYSNGWDQRSSEFLQSASEFSCALFLLASCSLSFQSYDTDSLASYFSF